MENTSMGYHTFAFFQKTDEEEYQVLENDFIGYMQRTKKLKRSPVQNKDKIQIGWQYTYKDDKEKGIHWLMLSSKAKNNYVTRGVLAVINQEALIENNYIRAAKDDDLKEVEEIYNRETENISKVWVMLLEPCRSVFKY